MGPVAIVGPLFADGVLVAEIDPREVSPATLAPREAAQVERAVTKRRREFAAGRLLARRLLRRLGISGFSLLNGEDRAPIWPPGIVGAISHTSTWAAVAVARAGGVASVGCDLERDEPLEEGILRRVCVPSEREWIAARPRDRRGRLAMLFFSAKEAAYKAQYPLSRKILDFPDFVLDLDERDGSFRAEFQGDVGGWRRGQALRGRWRTAGGLIATAVTIREGDVLRAHSM